MPRVEVPFIESVEKFKPALLPLCVACSRFASTYGADIKSHVNVAKMFVAVAELFF